MPAPPPPSPPEGVGGLLGVKKLKFLGLEARTRQRDGTHRLGNPLGGGVVLRRSPIHAHRRGYALYKMGAQSGGTQTGGVLVLVGDRGTLAGGGKIGDLGGWSARACPQVRPAPELGIMGGNGSSGSERGEREHWWGDESGEEWVQGRGAGTSAIPRGIRKEEG